MEQEKTDSKKSIYTAIAGNIAIGIVKFVASWISGSVSMMSEGIHSIVDSGNGILVLVGIRQSQKEPDAQHPFGYGKNLYFWTMIVALLIFFMGGGVSIFRGVQFIVEASHGQVEQISPLINYVVIGISMVIEGTSLTVAIRQLNEARGYMGPLKFIHQTADPSLFTVVFEDSAAELGLVFALLGNILTQVTGIPYFDGAASVAIGVVLCSVAIVLLVETKALLIGEGASIQTTNQVREIVEDFGEVEACGRILSMYIGPYSLLFAIDVTFSKDLTEEELQLTIDDIEREIHAHIPNTGRVFIEAENLGRVRLQKAKAEAEEKQAASEE